HESKDQMARLHAIWGLGQLSNRTGRPAPVLKLLADSDVEVRAQAAKVLGRRPPIHPIERALACPEPRVIMDYFQPWLEAHQRLLPLLKDASPRVRFFAAQSLAPLAAPEDIGPILEMLRDNADKDAYVRHAGVMALASQATKELVKVAQDSSS